jgi:hypothetical protein
LGVIVEGATVGGTVVVASVTVGALAVCVAAIAVCSAQAVCVAATLVAIVLGASVDGGMLHASSGNTTIKQDTKQKNILWLTVLLALVSAIAHNAAAPRNGGRIKSAFQSRAAPPLSWCVCSAII